MFNPEKFEANFDKTRNILIYLIGLVKTNYKSINITLQDQELKIVINY